MFGCGFGFGFGCGFGFGFGDQRLGCGRRPRLWRLFWVSGHGLGSFSWFLFSVPLYFPVYLFWIVFRFCCVSDTEEHLMPALNILFWNQVVEANQFISCALAPFIP